MGRYQLPSWSNSLACRRLHVAQYNNSSKSGGKEAGAVVAILKPIVAPVDRLEEQKRVSHPAPLLHWSRVRPRLFAFIDYDKLNQELRINPLICG